MGWLTTFRVRLVTAMAVLVGALSIGAVAIGSTTGPLQWSRAVGVDTFPPTSLAFITAGVSCPSRHLCVAVAGPEVVTSSNPTGGPRTWHHAPLSRMFLKSISCPSVHLCVASDGVDLFASTEPAAGSRAWRTIAVDDPYIVSLSCPVVHLCVAVDQNGHVLSSRDPTRGVRAWHRYRAVASSSFTRVSCSGARFCAAVTYGSRVFTTTHPLRGSAWSVRRIEKHGHLDSLSCPLRHLCVAGDHNGHLLTSTAPRSGRWSRTRLAENFVDSVWCETTRLCVAVGGRYVDVGEGEQEPAPFVFATMDPTGGRASWHRSNQGIGLNGVSCPAPDLCVAVAGGGDLTTSDPITGDWVGSGGISGVSDQMGISCPTRRFCATVDDAGNVLTTTEPARSPRGWHAQGLDSSGAEMSGISCPTPELCVGIDDGGGVLSSSNPRGGEAAWNFARIDYGTPDLGGYLKSIACPSVSLCVAVDVSGYAFTSTNPTGGASAWNGSDIDSNPSGTGTLPNALNTVACPATNLCVAGDNSGDLLSSTNPTGGPSAWSSVNIEHPQNRGGDGIVHVSCPSTNLCIAVDADGDIFTSTDPTGPASAWTEQVHGRYPTVSELGFTCASAHLCVGFGFAPANRMFYSTNPTGGASAWHETSAPAGMFGSDGVTAISCPSASPVLCLATSGPRVAVARSASSTG